MRIRRYVVGMVAASVVLLIYAVTLSACSREEERATDQTQTFADVAGVVEASDITIYYTILPAEVIQGGREAAMRGEPPHGRHIHHVMVALFHTETFERITDAVVTASVADLGMAPIEKQLLPMRISDALTYGNYFQLHSSAVFTIDIEVQLPDRPTPIEARISFHHE